MSNIDKRALREAAEKATPGPWEMEQENIWFTDAEGYTKHLIYVQQGDDVDDKQDHYNTAFIAEANPATILALLDELEAAERERDNWRNSFDNERFRADKLAEAFKAEHEQLVMANRALITQHVRANRAEQRIAELDSHPIATLDVQSGRDDGNKFALLYSSAAHKLPDDVYYLCVVPAAAGKGETS